MEIVMTTVATSEVLNRAADLIEERGWTKGGGWPTADDEGAALCLEGGIMAALGLHFDKDDDDVEQCPAYRAVHFYLGLKWGDVADWPQDPLWTWNDDHGSEESVIEVLRATAVIEAARENAETRAEVSA
jgi:hypothetical protein